MVRNLILTTIVICALSILSACNVVELDSHNEVKEIDNVRSFSMNPQDENQQQSITEPDINGYEAAYSLVIRNRTPSVDPGDSIEMEIFLSGYGVPEKNKLHISWSSPYVIDRQDPGRVYAHRFDDPPIVEGQIRVIQMVVLISEIGASIILDTVYFIEAGSSVPQCGLRQVAGEGVWGAVEKAVPILLIINTDKKAQSGDYEVTFTFTYGDEGRLRQDHKVAPFHITSVWERWQWAIYVGVGIAFLSLLISAFGIIWNIFKK